MKTSEARHAAAIKQIVISAEVCRIEGMRCSITDSAGKFIRTCPAISAVTSLRLIFIGTHSFRS